MGFVAFIGLRMVSLWLIEQFFTPGIPSASSHSHQSTAAEKRAAEQTEFNALNKEILLRQFINARGWPT